MFYQRKPVPQAKEKKVYRIPKVSKKKAKQIKVKNEARNKLQQEWIPGNCQACGMWQECIDPSHLLPQEHFGQYAGRKENIVPHCRHCHNLWHNPAHRWKLRDFVENMIWIQSVEPKEFERMLGQSELKVEKHYPEELPRFYEVRDSLL